MKLIFKEAGKYKSGAKVVIVTENDIEKEIPIEIDGKNSQNYVDLGRAEYCTDKKSNKKDNKKDKETKKDKEMKKDLIKFAKDNEIDIDEKLPVSQIQEIILKKNEIDIDENISINEIQEIILG